MSRTHEQDGFDGDNFGKATAVAFTFFFLVVYTESNSPAEFFGKVGTAISIHPLEYAPLSTFRGPYTAVTGLPNNTGLRLSRHTGELWGMPNEVDYRNSNERPMELTVFSGGDPGEGAIYTKSSGFMQYFE